MTKEETKNKFEKVIAAIADDIARHGVDALWNDEQFITGGKIVVNIDADMLTEIKYIRSVVTI